MKTEKLIAQDFYFYNNEETQLKGKLSRSIIQANIILT
jgi:hypothetical protein